MTSNLGEVSEGDLILFKHCGDVWRGVCKSRFPTSILVTVNKALMLEVKDDEVVEVVKKRV